VIKKNQNQKISKKSKQFQKKNIKTISKKNIHFYSFSLFISRILSGTTYYEIQEPSYHLFLPPALTSYSYHLVLPPVLTIWSYHLVLLPGLTTCQMVLKWIFDISTGFRHSKIRSECSVHICSCLCLVLQSIFFG